MINIKPIKLFIIKLFTIILLEFSPLAAQYKAINLGQGFPDFDGPEFVLKVIDIIIKMND